LQARRAERSFNGEVGFGDAPDALGEFARVRAAGGGEKLLALVVRHLHEPEHFVESMEKDIARREAEAEERRLEAAQ